MALFLSGHFPQITFSLFPAVFFGRPPSALYYKSRKRLSYVGWRGRGRGDSLLEGDATSSLFYGERIGDPKERRCRREKGEPFTFELPPDSLAGHSEWHIDQGLTTLPTAENIFLRTKPYATAFIFKNKVEPCHAMHGRFRSPPFPSLPPFPDLLGSSVLFLPRASPPVQISSIFSLFEAIASPSLLLFLPSRGANLPERGERKKRGEGDP